MEVMKFKGHPLTEEQLKAVKGGYEFIGLKGEANICPLCGIPLSDNDKTGTVYNENGNVIGYLYKCSHCGGMVEANGKA